MIRVLNSDQLLVFAAVARERGFSRAAERLSRTQSAVSQAVARLEEELGVRLFLRSGRHTEPTTAGRLLLEHANRVLGEMERARENLQALWELKEGSLVVGTSDTLAYYVLPPVIAAYRARYPGVDLRIDNRPSPATAERVVERRVDLGLVTLPLPTGLRARGRPILERLHIESLAPQEEVVICPPDHPLARRKRITLGALHPYPLLLLDRSTAGRAHLDAEFARLKLKPTVAMEMSSVEVIKRLVELGLGVAIVPGAAVERELAEGVVAVLRLEGLPGRSLGLVTPATLPLPRAAEAFAEMARAGLGQSSASLPEPAGGRGRTA
ncbi:MAG TPA: LysR family transcriptional regulator [Anaeromyxobacteraceae bacterium]|nr:LysR family transcriptional regulator [Anaeromyxobacteraceae bacterium]